MTVRIAVDFGTSSTCIAVSVHGREPQVVAVDGNPLMSSAVYAGPEGTLFVGQEADRQAAIDPSRYEPHPKRRIDEPELLLGNTVVGVREVIRAVLTRAVAEARRVAGGAAVDQLVLTHPADWGGTRTRVLRQAAGGLAGRIALVAEPVAAAVFHAASFPAAHGGPDSPALAVLDLGGGTIDVSVVRRVGAVFRVLATHGDPTFGGADIDQLLLDHVGGLVSTTDPDAWRSLIEGRELADRRRRRVIHQDVRGAKETLSRHNYTDIPFPTPFPDAHVTRSDLERLITGPLRRAVELTERTIREAGLRPAELSGIFLVGGSSRIPLVARLIHERCGVVPTALDQPETVVARGALRAVAADPVRTGVVAAQVVTGSDAGLDRTVPDAGAVRRQAVARPHPQPAPPIRPAPPGRRGRRPVLIGAAAALLAGAAVAVVLVLNADDPASSVRMIAQYDYQFALPDGWTQTGGDQDKRSTEVKPSSAQDSADRILVEETRLGYDSDTDRARALDKLRADFDVAGPNFSGYQDDARYAGRTLVHYRQELPNRGTVIEWYIMFKAHTQVSVGCEYGEPARDRVLAACETVVSSMAITE